MIMSLVIQTGSVTWYRKLVGSLESIDCVGKMFNLEF